MVIIFGKRCVGKVDRVGELCYVTTQFAHINYVLMVPVQSFVVVAGTEEGNGFKGLPISMSGKSVLAGYFRTISVLGSVIVGCILCFFMIPGWFKAQPAEEANAASNCFVTLMILAGFIGLYLVTLPMRKASYSRACELAEILGVRQEFIDEIYGMEGSSGLVQRLDLRSEEVNDRFGGPSNEQDRKHDDRFGQLPEDYDRKFGQ